MIEENLNIPEAQQVYNLIVTAQLSILTMMGKLVRKINNGR